MATKKTNVLHLIKSLGRGGAETLLPETLKLHDKNNFNFHCIYFLPWKDQMVSAIREAGGVTTCIPASNNIQLLMRVGEVVRYVRANNIDVIHAHLPWAGIVARIVGRKTGIPVVYTEHNKLERYHFLTRWMNVLTMNWLREIIAVSQDVAVSIKKFKPTLKPRLEVVLNGVNIDFFKPGSGEGLTIRKSLGIPTDALVVGTIAVFRFQKRLDLWIELASKIKEQLPEAHFIIVGDGPLKEQLLKKKDDLRMDALHFVGLQTEVRPYLGAFDIYMMSSVFEGLPIALLEAMSSGCAVVSTDAGGIKEVIRHEQDGLLCGVDDASRLVTYVNQLSNDRHKLATYAANARTRVAESFSIASMVEKLEQVYRRLVSRQDH